MIEMQEQTLTEEFSVCTDYIYNYVVVRDPSGISLPRPRIILEMLARQHPENANYQAQIAALDEADRLHPPRYLGMN